LICEYELRKLGGTFCRCYLLKNSIAQSCGTVAPRYRTFVFSLVGFVKYNPGFYSYWTTFVDRVQ